MRANKRRATIISFVSGVVATAVALRIFAGLFADPYGIPLALGAVAMVGAIIGGTTYLFMSDPRSRD